MQKVYIQTYGCQMNEYDSAKMLDVLARDCAMEPTEDPRMADLLLLNTCSVREKAQEKVFSQLRDVSPARRASVSANARLMWTSSLVRRPCIACPP